MGAIAGIVRFGGAADGADFLPPMLDAMKSRGPDDEGYALFEDFSSRPVLFGGAATPRSAYDLSAAYRPTAPAAAPLPPCRVAIGHRRLAVLDLSAAGRQPMCTPDERYWITLDGTVYNFREVRVELESEGAKFVTRTDTEVVLAAYDRWGAACLNKFNGCFAFAIWDRHLRRLFLARDRLGLKPLYYHRVKGCFLFASRLDGLFASGLVPAEVNPDGLYHCIVLQMAPRPMTAFKGVRMLEKSGFMFVNSDGTDSERIYWTMPFGLTDHNRSEDSYAEEFDAILNRAVERMLVSDAPVGTYISGGVDSTAVSALASKRVPGIRSFTLTHGKGFDIDELANARATAAMHDIRLVEISSEGEHAMAFDDSVCRGLEEPWISLPAGFVITKGAAKHGVKVMLGASGVDQCFLGFPLERKIEKWDLCRRLAPVLRRLPPLPGVLGSARRWAGFPTLADVYAYRFAWLGGTLLPEECPAVFDPAFLERVGNPKTGAVLAETRAFSEQRYEDRRQALCALDMESYLCNRLLRNIDAETGHAGMEVRSVALDREFLEFIAKLPSEMKTRPDCRKYLMRKVAAKYIHPDCLAQGKQGLVSPMSHWIVGPLRERTAELLRGLAGRSIFRGEFVERMAAVASAGGFDWQMGHKLWQMASTEWWIRAFGVC